MTEITIKKDGKVLTVLLDDNLGYFSLLGVFEGMLGEMLEIPTIIYEEHDG